MKNICRAIGIICVLSSSLVAMKSSKSGISIPKYKPFHVSGSKTIKDLYEEFNPSEEKKLAIYNRLIQQLTIIRYKRQLQDDSSKLETLFSRFINVHQDDSELIKRIRKKVFLLIHPDKNFNNKELSTEAFKSLNELFSQYEKRQERFLEFVQDCQNHKKKCNENKVGT